MIEMQHHKNNDNTLALFSYLKIKPRQKKMSSKVKLFEIFQSSDNSYSEYGKLLVYSWLQQPFRRVSEKKLSRSL